MRTISTMSGHTGCANVDPFDYHIWHLPEGVHNQRHPTGKGAQLLAHVMKHVWFVSGDKNVTVGGIQAYAEKYGIVVM
jgi:hypothetical protein